MLFVYSSSIRTFEVSLPLPCCACTCSRILCVVVSDVDRQQIWLARSSRSSFGKSVRKLVRGRLRRIWTNWNALSIPPELAPGNPPSPSHCLSNHGNSGDSVVISILGVFDPSSLDAWDVLHVAGFASSTRC